MCTSFELFCENACVNALSVYISLKLKSAMDFKVSSMVKPKSSGSTKLRWFDPPKSVVSVQTPKSDGVIHQLSLMVFELNGE